jgi:nesprin-1
MVSVVVVYHIFFQFLILSLRQNEAEFDKMSDDFSDLVQSSGETRISVNVQQITSRFQSIQNTAKVSLF